MAFFGNMYERLPQIKGGVQFGKGDFKVQAEAAVLLAAFGDANLANTPPGIPVPTNSVAEQLNNRFGARIGSDSGQPAVEGRVVFQYPIFHSARRGACSADIQRTPCDGIGNRAARNIGNCRIADRRADYRGSRHAPLPIQ